MSHTTAPIIACNDREKEIVLIVCDVMGGIDPNESIPEVLECVVLEGYLNA